MGNLFCNNGKADSCQEASWNRHRERATIKILVYRSLQTPEPQNPQKVSKRSSRAESQGALKGRAEGDKPSPNADFRRFSQIFADSRLSLENKAFGKRRFSQETADFCRKPQKTAGTRRKPQIGVRPLRFVPLSAALRKSGVEKLTQSSGTKKEHKHKEFGQKPPPSQTHPPQGTPNPGNSLRRGLFSLQNTGKRPT